ncbi:MAG: RNA methyltransferase [Bacteroidales bacterium]|nr:RNA methyltransferase [Bacteroidales bacterium]
MLAKISNNECKYFASLRMKKFRQSEKLFVVEGEKMVIEAIVSNMAVTSIIGIPEWWQNTNIDTTKFTCRISTPQQIKQISQMVTPPPVLAVVQIPQKDLQIDTLQDKVSIALENIQDPGNLGTIIRLADWFGIENVICSYNSVEVYNPKVIQATMGSIFRVNVFYVNLISLFYEAKKLKISLLGTFLNGENVYSADLPMSGILIMGNESKGISDELARIIDKRITIPSAHESGQRAESLNVALAASIVCSEWFRKLKWENKT